MGNPKLFIFGNMEMKKESYANGRGVVSSEW